MNPSGSGASYSAPGSWTKRLGVTRQNESQRRERQVSATRPDSRTTWSNLACVRYQLVASPACPPPTIATLTLRSIDGRNLNLETEAVFSPPRSPGRSPATPAGGATRADNQAEKLLDQVSL